jgi:hypothetical protein
MDFPYRENNNGMISSFRVGPFVCFIAERQEVFHIDALYLPQFASRVCPSVSPPISPSTNATDSN